uniref:Protein kinase domain-containing protein n=1 Tax=Davidia involucrata TaxID=16924 RepID=A0A5B7BPI2_DAVIN
MEKNTGRSTMGQHKNYEQVRYNSVETRNEGVGSPNHRFFHDPSSSINTNMRPPDFNIPVGARPVLNYSIQTGEEFALEFMRERVNPRQHFIPNVSGDSNGATTYTDLKGILGITHAGSESGSDISMITSNEKGRVQEYDRKGPSLHEDKGYYESMRSVPRTSSRNDSTQGAHGYASSGVSDSSSTKVKFLCSFGGKILPRPSDGKLRYVSGETRIIRISKGISWQELMQKTFTIYNQAHIIKYQLPGEDLDALVSVSCDEDLQNMMEECNALEDGGSQKLRMFLFSSSDLDDSQVGLGSVEGDSEIQYVVAVNGMDLGSRKNSIGLGSSSGNNLDELLNLNVGRETGRVAAELVGADAALLIAGMPSSTNQSSQPVLPSLSPADESNPQAYQGQIVHHGEVELHPLHPREGFHNIDAKNAVLTSFPLQYGYGSHPFNYAPIIGNLVPTTLHGHMTRQEGPAEEQPYSGFPVQDPEVSVKEVKLKRDGISQRMNELEKNQSLEKGVLVKEAKTKRESSFQKMSEPGKIWPLEKEYIVSSHPYDSSVPNDIPREASDDNSVADTGAPLLPTKNHKKRLEPVQNSVPHEAVNEGKMSKLNEDDHYYMSGKAVAPGFGDSEANPTDYSYLEPPLLPQRVFHSERIPREQAELNRLSKSEDSFDPLVLISHARSDLSQKITESVDKLHDGSQMEQSISSAKLPYTNPQTVEDGLAQVQKYKEVADSINKMNSKVSEEALDSKFQQSELKPVVLTPMDGREMAQVMNNYGDHSDNDKETAGLNHPIASQGTSTKRPEDSASRALESHWGEMTVDRNNGNTTKGHAHLLALSENPLRALSRGESYVGAGTTEQGDILININDRFPLDFLSDIFSKAGISEDLAGLSPLHSDGTGLSMNMENHDPKRWSFFQKLAAQEDFVRKDVSLMDQDHLGFSSPLTNIAEGASVDYSFPPLKTEGVSLAHMDSHINFDADIQQPSSVAVGPNTMDLHPDYSPSQINGSESVQFDGLVNPRTPESDNEDGKLEAQHAGTPLVDLSLGEFDISTLQIIKNEDLEELRELGSGTFGTVYHGKWRGTDVAIKRIKKSCFTGRSSEQERLTVEFWREADILSKLHHPNVVAFYGVVQDGPGGTLATVTEFMVNGSLRHVLLCKERNLDRRKRIIIAMDAAFGMEYLHSKNIVHFDLKCDNLLVNLKDPLRPICKVGDFGLSKIKRNTLVTGGVRGTLPWMAPELLNGSSSKVSEKVDVFSFGIVLWEILTGDEPYANMHYGAIIGGIVSNTLRPPVPSYCDAEWRLLMEQCWAPNPVARPSFTEIARRLRAMSVACQTKPQGYQAQNQVPK